MKKIYFLTLSFLALSPLSPSYGLGSITQEQSSHPQPFLSAFKEVSTVDLQKNPLSFYEESKGDDWNDSSATLFYQALVAAYGNNLYLGPGKKTLKLRTKEKISDAERKMLMKMANPQSLLFRALAAYDKEFPLKPGFFDGLKESIERFIRDFSDALAITFLELINTCAGALYFFETPPEDTENARFTQYKSEITTIDPTTLGDIPPSTYTVIYGSPADHFLKLWAHHKQTALQIVYNDGHMMTYTMD